MIKTNPPEPASMRTINTLFSLIVIASLGTACSSQQTYASGQTWQRNECNKIIDMQERQRCVAKANDSYDSYQKQVDELKKPGRAD
jgi:membrane protein DedA with SNARE-associated domain